MIFSIFLTPFWHPPVLIRLWRARRLWHCTSALTGVHPAVVSPLSWQSGTKRRLWWLVGVVFFGVMPSFCWPILGMFWKVLCLDGFETASCNAKLVLAALANYSQNLTVPERTWRQKAWKWSSSLETEMKTPSRNTSMSSHGWQWTSMPRSRCFVPSQTSQTSQTSQKAKHQQLMWPRRPCRSWTRPSKSRASQVSSSWMLMANSSLRTEGRRFPKTPRVKTCHGHLAWLCRLRRLASRKPENRWMSFWNALNSWAWIQLMIFMSP